MKVTTSIDSHGHAITNRSREAADIPLEPEQVLELQGQIRAAHRAGDSERLHELQAIYRMRAPVTADEKRTARGRTAQLAGPVYDYHSSRLEDDGLGLAPSSPVLESVDDLSSCSTNALIERLASAQTSDDDDAIAVLEDALGRRRRAWAEDILGPYYLPNVPPYRRVVLEPAAHRRITVDAWDSHGGREAGGILVGRRYGDDIVVVDGIRANLGSPRQVTLDFAAGEELALEMGLDVVASWHTHPAGGDDAAMPSLQDRKAMARGANSHTGAWVELILRPGRYAWIDPVAHPWFAWRNASGDVFVERALLHCERHNSRICPSSDDASSGAL